MAKALTKSDGYRTLVSQVIKELTELELFVKHRTAEGYWKIGKYINDHLLENKQRANYGATLYDLLAKDVDRDVSTLQRSVQFYRTYPIPAARRELSWDHYRSLITIKDDKKRKQIEGKIIRHDWNTQQLRHYLSAEREQAAPTQSDKPVSPLTFSRGRLHTYQIIKAHKPLQAKSPLVLDLGFRQEYRIPRGAPSFKENNWAELSFSEGELSGATKVAISIDELFTYKAYVDKIIDGDTLLVSFDFNLDVAISQKLRLRGIDCPEIATEEGKRAKRFVESRLKKCDFIIVKTYKDRSDKFDRYLADIFYTPNVSDPRLMASDGTFLNQELLDKHLAVKYEH